MSIPYKYDAFVVTLWSIPKYKEEYYGKYAKL